MTKPLSRLALGLTLWANHWVTTAATVALDEAARRAHEEVPQLRQRETERWTRTEELLVHGASAAREPDAPRDLAYEWNQYGSGSSNQYDTSQQYQQDANGNYYEPWDPDLTETDFGFDVRSYSFKYTGCHDLGHWWQGQEETATRYATFRLCPTETCSAYSTFGCQSDYGEYIVPVDLLVTSLMEHNQARVAGYCEYCESCATVESYKQFFSEVSIQKQYVINYAKAKFETWCSQNGYSNGYAVSMDDDGMYLSAAQALWKEMRNGNYATTYVSQTQNSQSSNEGGTYQTYSGSDYATQYNKQSWNLQGESVSSKYSNSEKAWQTMGSTFGTWYDQTIYPGYYDSYGTFQACWGYTTSKGNYICLDDSTSIYWDSNIFGSIPSSWESFQNGNALLVDQVDFCQSSFSSSCFNQYDACMQVFNEEQQHDDDADDTVSMPTLNDLLECTAISEEQMTVSGLSFAEQYSYTQQRNQEYREQYYDNGNGYQSAYNYDGDGDSIDVSLYVGPACGEDNMAIALAVYGDAYCTQKVERISVSQLLGYNPLSENMDVFPSECISCRPPEDELLWYETEEVDDPVLPFCSMLYQLSGKCNKRLRPRGGYDADSVYAYEDDDLFLADTCSMADVFNEEIHSNQSRLKRWADGIRMASKKMSPASKAAFLLSTLLFAGMTVMAYMYWKMYSVLNKDRSITADDIAEIPSFKYQNAENETGSGVGFAPGEAYNTADLDWTDSGVGVARGEDEENRFMRYRTNPIF